jgi:hypothetical protein
MKIAQKTVLTLFVLFGSFFAVNAKEAASNRCKPNVAQKARSLGNCARSRFSSSADSDWLEKVLKDNPNQSSAVFLNQGMYSMASNRIYVKMRDVLLPIYDKYGVDLVLQGHDHLYARSLKLAGGKVVSPDAPGTVYMISVSGPKMYEVDHRFEPLMAKVISHTQMFQLKKSNGQSLYAELPE